MVKYSIFNKKYSIEKCARHEANNNQVKKKKIPECLKKLTYKQRAFVLRYLVHFNGTKAAIEAGYSIKTATMQSSRMLTKANISAAINELLDTVGLSRKNILIKLAQYTEGDLSDFEGLLQGKTLTQLKKEGVNIALIKKLKSRRQIIGKKDEEEEYEITDIELVDRRATLMNLAELTGLVKKTLELTGPTAVKFTFDEAVTGEEDKTVNE